ncbi:hypothetical protein [Massilia phyllosphaerae]|uniref:hypothetical protein n=1 Tax=Massilia phyllosphaerae TaxID=3106034 RepID=UPI002B1CACC1|nr:hypothetical protein [Massilia sp. SGZ-792]
MLSHEALRQAAQTTPAVLVPSDTLLELLDLAAKVEKKTKVAKVAREVDPNDEKCARCLFDLLLETMPKAKQPNFKAWAEDVRLMRERDGRKRSEICELFQWAQAHRFWRANVRCPAKLREHWDGLWIQRETDAQPKKSAGNWWATDETTLAKGRELGIAPRSGEYMGQFKARIEAMLDPGNEPKVSAAPPAAPLPAAAPPVPVLVDQPDRRAQKPEGIGALKDLVRKVVLPARAA